MIINRKPLSSYFLQSQNQPMEGGFVHQKQMQYQLQQQTLSEQFNNYPQNKMQAWQELNHKITKQINIMLKKKITEQRDDAQTQKQEEKKQLDEIYGKDKTKVNYLVFSTAKRRSVSTDDLKLSQIYNKFQYNLSQAPKKSILKLESSYKQRNNYTHTENDDSSSSPILLRHIEERRTVDPETNKEDNQRSIQSYILQTPEIHKQHSDQFSNSSTSSSSHMNESRQRYLSYDRPSSCSEIKQKKRVQFSDTIRKLRVKYEDQSSENNHSHHHNLHAKSQVIFANKVTPFIVPTQQQHITQLISQHQQQQLQQQQQQQQQQQSQIQQPHQQQMNQSQQQLSQSQLSQQSKDFQPQQSLSDFKPYTIQTYRTALSTKLFQQHKPQLNNSQKVNQDDQSGKILLRDKLQIMNSNFRDRLQKKLNQALEKKEELKKLQQIIQQPLQITNIQPKQVQSYPTVQYLIKLPSRKQLSQIQS